MRWAWTLGKSARSEAVAGIDRPRGYVMEWLTRSRTAAAAE